LRQLVLWKKTSRPQLSQLKARIGPGRLGGAAS